MCNLSACEYHPRFSFGFRILSLLAAGEYNLDSTIQFCLLRCSFS